MQRINFQQNFREGETGDHAIGTPLQLFQKMHAPQTTQDRQGIACQTTHSSNFLTHWWIFRVQNRHARLAFQAHGQGGADTSSKQFRKVVNDDRKADSLHDLAVVRHLHLVVCSCQGSDKNRIGAQVLGTAGLFNCGGCTQSTHAHPDGHRTTHRRHHGFNDTATLKGTELMQLAHHPQNRQPVNTGFQLEIHQADQALQIQLATRLEGGGANGKDTFIFHSYA